MDAEYTITKPMEISNTTLQNSNKSIGACVAA
jgi:hypothetical protein